MPDEIKSEETVVFPQLAKGSAVFYETERHEIWIGVPLRNAAQTKEGERIDVPIEPLLVSLALDRAKYEGVAYLMQDRGAFMEEQQRKQGLSKSGILTRASESLKSGLKNLVSLKM